MPAAEASVRRRELELEDAALVRQMAEHQALCDSLRAQATEQLKDVERPGGFVGQGSGSTLGAEIHFIAI